MSYSTMDTYIKQFSSQLAEAIQIGESAHISPAKHPIQNILLSGLGGSGIGGALAADLLANELSVPMNVNNGYFLPNYVNENTLLIISSYSGNTEETVNALNEGIERGAKIVCVSTNGKVEELAKQHELDFVILPTGIPPRGGLNLSFPQSIFILHHLGLVSDSIITDLKNAVDFLTKNEESCKTEGLAFAKQLVGKVPIIYAEDRIESVAIRFRQQINENGKMLAWHHVIPELNHNELVGWTHRNEDLALIFLKNDDDYYRNQKRMTITEEVAKKYTPNVFTIQSKGGNLVEKALYLILFTDWVSFGLATETGADAVEVNVIDYLKGELAKI